MWVQLPAEIKFGMHQFHRWRDALRSAHSEIDVQNIVETYVSSISPQIWAILPAVCRCALKHTDVMTAAATLLQEEVRYRANPEVAPALHNIALTFSAASARLIECRVSHAAP